uniref:cytochrome P450 CYP736A12-like n=1 Tax=Erigeron canadensis TaxID=72917 RepID=UPI001CB8E591|nr:cytochrome P450 CYP736A12-like [Erigeron canadensis]
MYSIALSVLVALIGIILFYRWFSGAHSNLPPGPKPLPIIGSLHLLGTLPHRALHKLSQMYGPIMSIRLGSVQFVIISSPDAAKLFLGTTHDAIFASRPKIQAAKYLSYGCRGMAFSEYGPYWRSVRKFCTLELLSAKKVSSFVGMRKEEISLMVDELKDAAKTRKVVNLSERVGVLIEGMVCRMLFGKKNDDRFVFKTIVDEITELAGSFNVADYVPILAPFDLQGLTKRIKSLSKDVDHMLEILMKEHEDRSLDGSKKPDEVDFIDILLSQKHNGDLSYTLDRSTMKAILLDMIVGSIDTSKTAIEWTLCALIKYPRVMNKLQKELKTVIGNKPLVEETDLTKLTYLHMVVKETFRLYPVAPLLVPHQSVEDTMISGYNIPKDTRVLVNFWAFGRDPKVWSDNWEEFLPERFLNQDIDYRGSEFQLIPFGVGRRGCPGMNLGLLSVNLVVSNIVHCFDWMLPNDMSPSDLGMKEKFGLSMPRDEPLLAIPACHI